MQVWALRQQSRFAGAVLTLQQPTPQIRAMRSDRPDPAPHAADTPHKRCSVVLRRVAVDVSRLSHNTQTTRYKYSTK